MRLIVVLTLVGLVALVSASDKVHYDIADAPQLFQKFIHDYNRVYKNHEDKKAHYAIFVANLEEINRLNARDHSATFDINQFADISDEEFEKHHTGLRPQ